MDGMMGALWWLWFWVVGVFPLVAYAQNTSTIPSSTFYLAQTETQFSVNIANDSTNVSIYFTSPAYSWVGVGFGKTMENSLMFIMYPNENGDNVTVSPRIGTKDAEPTFTSNIKLDVLAGTTINDSMLILEAVCRNCRDFFNVESTQQPMMYAFGHGTRLNSNSPSADLKRHIRYGRFEMNMLDATGAGGVPGKITTMNGVKMQGGMVRDHDRANLAHAIIGCLALFVVWPLNLLVAGFFKNIRIHVGVSVVVMGFLVVAYALGIATSAQFNRSKDYKTPHQIFAFIALAPILLITLLPIPNISRLHTYIPRLHIPLVSTSFVLLILTGGLGLHLSSQSRTVVLSYTVVALTVFILTTMLQSCIRRRGSAHSRANRTKPVQEDDGIMLNKMTESRSSSNASLKQGSQVSSQSREFSQQRQSRQGIFGGGTMPGPQYMLNMHPGVPVNKW